MTVDIQRAPYAGWRALAATVLVMAGAVFAHTWAGGHLPDGSVVIALAALVLGGSLLVLRGTVSGFALLPVIALAQAGLHASSVVSATSHTEHLGQTGLAATWTWQMVLAHLAVTVLTALVWHLCGRAVVVVVTLFRFAPMVAGRRAARMTRTDPPRPASHLILLVAAPRRGPPTAPSCA